MAFKDYSNDIANVRKKKNEEKKSSTISSGYKDYSSEIERYRLSNVIGFDTLQSDLSSLSKTIDSVYNGWQTRETMENTRSSIQSMYDRLGVYQEYTKQYGGTDLSELQKSYKSILDDWDGISKHYGKYKNADAYNEAVKNAKKQAEEYEGMKTADLGIVQKEVADLDKIYSTAKKYNDKAVDYSKQSMNIRNPSAVEGFSKTLKKLTDERDAYLKSVGYESMEALEKALGEKRVYLGKAQRLQDSIALSSVADMNSENYDKDFNKYAEKGKALGQEKNDWWNGGGTYKNQIAYMRENPDYLDTYEDVSDENGKIIQSINLNQLNYLGAKYMTDDEANVYNYYIGREDEKGAENYLKSIEETLKQRQGTAIYDERESMLSKYTFGYTAGIDQFTQGIINEFNTKDNYIPTTGIQNASGLVREDIQYEHGTLGQVGYDLINTTSNMLPSILTSTVVGAVASPVAGQVVGGALMGTSAAGNAYQEMLNLGYDKGQARTYSNLVGFAEAGLQSLMGGIGKLGGVSGKLSKLVSGIDNGLAKFAIRWGGSALSEGLEEATQEVLSPIFQNLAAGYDTGAEIDWSEVVYSGLLGALSGGVLEGGDVALNTYAETSYNKNMGQNIKANERVGEVFDIASNPEVASAYEAYTRYAKKGINADNISDAKLGGLYSKAKADAQGVLKDKKSTEEQKTEALRTLTRLSAVETENTVKKEAKAEFNVGEETKVTDSGVEVDVKDLKIKGDEVTFATENGEVSVDDVTLTQKDAELVLLAKGIAKTDGEDMANLFISQYDGKTSAEEYATSFNLTMAYAKNDFTYETILNKKRSLSAEQVSAIYAETRIKADRERQNKIDELNKSMADKMSYKGFIDDSAVDEATWNKLDSQQKQAVTFIKGIAQATGMNLVLTHNPDSKVGGSYNVTDNTITIDVAKFKYNAGKVMETIIPTMSHETTHWMEEKSPELWRRMNELVFSTLQEADGISEDVRISREMLRLKNKGREGTEKEARSEIIARACEDMLSMSEQGKKIFNSLSESEQKTLKEKIKEIIQNLKDWVSELLGAYKSNSYEAKLMRQYEEKLNELSKLWDEMFAESVVANQSLEKSGAFGKETSAEGDVLYEIRDEYASEIAEWEKDGMPNGETFILGTTGDVLQGLGAIESDIYMLGDKIKEILNDHPEMTIDEIKKIPQILENPILILKSQNVGRDDADNTRLVIFGKIKAKDGLPILSVLDLRPVENHLAIEDMQKVSSAYTKDTNPVDFVKNSLVVYADKKRTAKLLRTIGFSAPIELQLSGYIGSISYMEQNVNINGEEFSKVFKEVTKDKGMRFSMRDNVEETKDLIAVHNMRVSELERTLDLGGLPMPSIAIIKAQSGHSEYGDVSLVFNKETIDPKTSRLNKVYGGDAWTPTYPTIEYKPNAKVAKKISDKYYELSRKIGHDESRPLYNYVYDMEEQLNRHKGEASLLEELYDDEKMMQLYLLDSGKSKVETIQKEISTELTDAEVEMNEYFIRELGADVVDGVMWDGNGTPMSHRKNYLSKYEDAIRETYKKLLSETYQFSDEQVQNVLDSTKPADLIKFMRDAYKYRQNGRVTTRTEADYETTKEAIKEAVGDGYRGWVDSLFKGIEEKSGIRNNTDVFTYSGNRRSWEALHWENNLENVVRLMKSQENGQALFSGMGIWGVSAKEYSSISDIKADSSRLAKMSQEEYDSIKENFGERFQEIAISIMDKSEKNQFIAIDNAMECIVDAIRVSKTKSGILNALRQYRHLSITEATVDDIVSLVTDISNMPTEYFEAKPKRAVELNEIATAIIPDNTSEATKARLDNMGIKYLEYESGNEQSRLDALNSLEEVRFSDREDISVYDIMGETDRILKENEKLKADVERLNERLKIERKVTKGNYFNANQLGAVAGHLRNISNSSIDKVELMRSLKDVYSFIAESSEVITEELFEKCYRIADAMLENAKPEVIVDDYYKMILKDIRNTRISLSESQKKEAQNIFDKNWNRYFFGNVIITDKGIGLESKWQEWASQYPGVFDADISDGDMIGELYNIISTLREASETVVEYNEEERKVWLANEIYNQYWNVSPIKTTADKYNERIKQLNFEHRKAMAELRNDYKARLEAQKLADDIHYGKKVSEVRNKRAEVEEQRKADREKFQKLYKAIRDRKDKEIALAKQHGRERMAQYKENAERKTVVQRITANALTLKKWLEKNNKDYHIHEAMKGPVVKLLQAIDFSSNRMLEKGDPTQRDISFAEAFAEVRAMLQDADNMVEGLEALYGHDLAEDIKALSTASFNLIGDDNYVINAMSNEELKHLDRLVSHIKKVVSELNKFHTVHHNQGAYSLANEFMEHGETLGSLKKQHGKIGKFLEFRNRTPYYFFKDLGNVGRKLFEAFQDGWDKLAFNAKKVIDFAEETYTDKEVKKWSKETKEFKVSQLDGSERTFEMSIAQIMALHCVAKQEDALRHLMSGGMTLKRIDKKGHVVADYENINLSLSDIQSILSSLDKRQREVADKLQNFMNTVCSEWGNEISMARFGIKMFGLPDYFPIKVSEATVPTDNTKDVDNASLFRLLNMSFTKSRNKYAEQSIEIGDIFDIFAQHASDMAKYNALALPVLDFNKFYSIHGKDGMGKEYGVVKTLKSVFGDEANGYLRRFVRDLNGSQNVSRDVIGNTFFKNAKVASVAANLRVVLLQPTAYHKASAVMDNKYLLKASAYMKGEPIGMVKKYKKAIANAEKYCGIVQWKSLGYYDTDISKGITEKIKHADTIKDKIIEKSMKGAEIADKVTFGTLWVACEFEIRETRKDLKVGSEEFYTEIGKRLRDVIYATQVVDSTMTRSDMMRSSDGRDKMLTTFGSEPIIAYNMLLDMAMQHHRDKQEFGSKEARKRNGKKIRKVVTAYVITNVAAALVESAFDWWRDDDDEELDAETFLKLYLKNFAFDMSIGNKLPIVKEVYSIMQGYSSSRMDTQWAQYLYSAATTRKPSKAIKDILRGFSQISGFAFYNLYRDIMATLNKLDIFTTDDLNEMFGLDD